MQNKSSYRKGRIVRGYRKIGAGLTIRERACFDVVPASDRGSILDIGIGAGRTTGPIAEMFKNYVGIDYSPEMIEAARLQYPGKDLRVMDARKLDLDEQFDCVMFSFNGIDCVDYADRQLILRQVIRKLRRGGYFIYSTHKLDYPRVAVWMNCFWVKELLVKRRQLLRHWNQFCVIFNRYRNFGRQTIDKSLGIAYVNDPGLYFATITTYVDMAKELEMLRRYGFRTLITIGNTNETPGYDSNDNWVYIAAQKD